MRKKDEFSLLKAEIHENYKDQFLIELSNMNIAHLKAKEEPKLKKEIEEKDRYIGEEGHGNQRESQY